MAVDVVPPVDLDTMEVPPKLELRTSEVDADLIGIWSKSPITAGHKFGPFVGEKVTESSPDMDSTYVWEIVDLETKEFLFYIDATDPAKGNWMRYIQCARYFEEQNIVSQQEGIDIYYKAIKDIGPGEELLTWYEKIPLRKSRGKKFTGRSGNVKPRSRSGSTDSNQSEKAEKMETRPKSARRTIKMSSKALSLNEEVTDLDTDALGHTEQNSVHADTEHDKVSLNSFSSGQSKPDETSSTHSQGVEPGKYLFELQSIHVVKSRLGRKVFKCDICSGVYRHAFSLKRHFIRNHVNYKYVSKADMLNCNINLDFYVPSGIGSEFMSVKQEVDDVKSGEIPKASEVDINENDTKLKDETDAKPADTSGKETACETDSTDNFTLKDIDNVKDDIKSVEEKEEDACQEESVGNNNSSAVECKNDLAGVKDSDLTANQKDNSSNKGADSGCEEPISKLLIDCDNVKKEPELVDCENGDLNAEKMQESESPPSEDGDNKGGKKVVARKDSLGSSSAMPGLFRCNVCHEKFDTISELKGHIINHPVLPSRAFSCDSCDMKFSHKQNLMRHLAVHTGAKPYSCKFCGKKFPTVTNQKRHERIHMGRRISCEYCQSSFTQSGDLKKHMRKLHPENFHDCAFCGKFFVGEDQLEDHLVTGHQETLDSNASEAVRRRQAFNIDLETDRQESMKLAQQAKPGFKFACTICKKRFHDYANMCRHRRLAHQRHLLINKGSSFDSPLPSPTKSVSSDHGELDPHIFYANVAKNISDNLNYFVEGKLEHLAHSDTHIKWKSMSVPKVNIPKEISLGDKCPSDEPLLTKYNFPPEFEYQDEKIKPVETTNDSRVILSVPNGFSSPHISVGSGRIKVQEVRPFHISAADAGASPVAPCPKPTLEVKSLQCYDSHAKVPPPLEEKPKSAIKVPSVHICSYCRSIFHNSELFRQHMFQKHKAPLPPLEHFSSKKAEALAPSPKRLFTDSLLSIPCYSAHKSKRPVMCGGALDLSKSSNITEAEFLAMTNRNNSDSDSDDQCPLDLSMSSSKGSSAVNQSQAKEMAVMDLTCKEVLDPKLELQTPHVLNVPKWKNSESCVTNNLEKSVVCPTKVANTESSEKSPAQAGHKDNMKNQEFAKHKAKMKNTNIRSPILNRPQIHVCTVCRKEFQEMEELVVHQDVEHPNVNCSPLTLDAEVNTPWWPTPNPVGLLNVCSSGLPPSSEDVTEQKFICTKCGNSFAAMSSLHCHIVTCASLGKEETKRPTKFRHHRRSKFNKGLGRINVKKRIKKKLGRDSPIKNNLRKKYLDGKKRVEQSTVKRAILRKIKQQELHVKDVFDSVDDLNLKRRRRRNFELLYNPKKHARRREQTEFLDMHRCRGCHLRFQTISLLERHIRTCIHKDRFKDIKVMKPLVTAFGQSALKKHMCRYCDKQFTYMGSLRKHMIDVCTVRKVKVKRGDVLATDWENYVIESARMAKEGLVRQLSGSSADDNIEIKRRKRKGKRKNHGWGYVKKRRVSKEVADAEAEDSVEFVDGECSLNEDAVLCNLATGPKSTSQDLADLQGNDDDIVSQGTIDLAVEFDNNSVATSELTDEYDVNCPDDRSVQNSEDMKLSELAICGVLESASEKCENQEIQDFLALPDGADSVNNQVIQNQTERRRTISSDKSSNSQSTKGADTSPIVPSFEKDRDDEKLLKARKTTAHDTRGIANKVKSDAKVPEKVDKSCDNSAKSVDTSSKGLLDLETEAGIEDSSQSDSGPDKTDHVNNPDNENSEKKLNEASKKSPVASVKSPKKLTTPRKEIKTVRNSQNKELAPAKETKKGKGSKSKKSVAEESVPIDFMAELEQPEITPDVKVGTPKKKKQKKMLDKCEEPSQLSASPTKTKKKKDVVITTNAQPEGECEEPSQISASSAKTKKKKDDMNTINVQPEGECEEPSQISASPAKTKKKKDIPNTTNTQPEGEPKSGKSDPGEVEDIAKINIGTKSRKRSMSKAATSHVDPSPKKKKLVNKKESEEINQFEQSVKKTTVKKLGVKGTVEIELKTDAEAAEVTPGKETQAKKSPKKKATLNTKVPVPPKDSVKKVKLKTNVVSAAKDSQNSQTNKNVLKAKLKKKLGKKNTVKCLDSDDGLKKKAPGKKKAAISGNTVGKTIADDVNKGKPVRKSAKKAGKNTVPETSDSGKTVLKKKGGKKKQADEAVADVVIPKKPGPKKKPGPGRVNAKTTGRGKDSGAKELPTSKGQKKKGGKP